MKKDEIGARLRSKREKIGLSRDQVVAHINYSRSTLQQWEAGSTEPPISAIEQLAKLYQVNPQYLIFGDDNQLIQIDDTSAAINDDDYDYIPYYDQSASAGLGMLVADDETSTSLAFPKWWSRQRGLKASDLCGLNTKGDSMQPTIPDGSILILDRSKTHPIDGKIYVIRVDGELYVKRVQRLPTGIRLISDNTDYSNFDVPKDELSLEYYFQVIGQVVHIGIDLPR